MFTRIVVGWDGSPESDAALEWAVERGVATPLTLVHATDSEATSGELGATGDLSSEGVRFVETAERLRTERPDLHVSTTTIPGTPATVLAEFLDEQTLVVVGAPSSHRGSRWTVGSRLAGRHGGGTVAVIPSDFATGARSGVVVGVDGSTAAMTAIEAGASEARRIGEDLELVHAWNVPSAWETEYVEYPADVDELEEMHRELLDAAVEFAKSHAARPIGRLERGTAVEVLERIGRQSSLLVVGSHGASVLARFLLGSVSHDLLVSLPAPIMVVGPRD